MRLSFLNEEEQKYSISQTNWEHLLEYSVLIKEKDHFPFKQINTVSYKVSIQCTKDDERPIFHYQIKKKNILINHSAPKTAFDVITVRIAAILNVLQLEVGYLGNLRRILNFADIKELWFEERKQLIKEYQGDVITNYINIIDRTLQKEDTLFQKLKKDPFLMNYFGPYYASIATEERQITAFDFFAGSTVHYHLTQKQTKETPEFIALVHTAEETITHTKKIIDSLIKKGLSKDQIQEQKIHATLQNKVIIEERTGQIDKLTSEQLLRLASQKIKTSGITIKKI